MNFTPAGLDARGRLGLCPERSQARRRRRSGHRRAGVVVGRRLGRGRQRRGGDGLAGLFGVAGLQTGQMNRRGNRGCRALRDAGLETGGTKIMGLP